MGCLQLNAIEHEKLIQKHAARLSIPEVKVTPDKFSGPVAMTMRCCPTASMSCPAVRKAC